MPENPSPEVLTLEHVVAQIKATTKYDTLNFILTVTSFVIVVGGLAYNTWRVSVLHTLVKNKDSPTEP